MHYNWHRYYDPDTGRYLTPDPIGLAGGINPFVYSYNDPVNLIDPEGLIPKGFFDDPRVPDNFKSLSKDLQKAMIDAYVNEQKSKTGSQLINIYTPTDFTTEPQSEYDKCLDDCLIKAIIGENPMSPIQGEAKTYLMGKAGEIALKKAAKKGIETGVVRIGSKLVPGLGAISTGISVKQFIDCAKECPDCP